MEVFSVQGVEDVYKDDLVDEGIWESALWMSYRDLNTKPQLSLLIDYTSLECGMRTNYRSIILSPLLVFPFLEFI